MQQSVAASCLGKRRVVVRSIGEAGPAQVAAVARGLGAPLAQVVASLYRAPAVIADGVEPEAAEALVRLLRDIGFEAHDAPEADPPPPPALLHDVALHLSDPRALPAAAATLASFAGMDVAAAREMILTPPGVVLGGVSAATVVAFVARLPEGIEAVAARPEDSSWHLFLLDGPAVLRGRLLADLAPLGVPGDAAPGLVAAGVAHQTLCDLWRRHQATGLLRAVNAAFLRYDVVLAGPGRADPEDPAVVAALEAETGMPAHFAPAAFADLPLTVAEGVAHDALASRMGALAALGLDVRAELTTFQRVGLEVVACADRAALGAALAAAGIGDRPAPTPPFEAPGTLPELRARVLRAALEDAGAVVRVMGGSA